MNKYNDKFIYIILRPIVSFLFKILYRPRFYGLSNIPRSNKFILAGNHTNNLDCLLLISSLKKEIHFLAKNELWSGPKKIIFSNLGLIPVNRKVKDNFAFDMSCKYLLNNKVIGIFPEGTYPKKGEILLPFKNGAVRMAYDTNSVIIPFVIKGKYKMFSRGLSITFLSPLKVSSNDFEFYNNKLRDNILDFIKEG